MFAGGITGKGTTPLILIPKNMTIGAKEYQEVIIPDYLKSMRGRRLFNRRKPITFMQDGAPSHSAKSTLTVSF